MKEKRTGSLRRIVQRVRATFDRRTEEKEIEQEQRTEGNRRSIPHQRTGKERRSDEYCPALTNSSLSRVAIQSKQPAGSAKACYLFIVYRARTPEARQYTLSVVRPLAD